MDELKAHEIEINVLDSDIDILGHINNVVYLRYVQEAAISHWTNLASKEDQEKYLWVVARHEIDYKRPAFKKDRIIARTWVGEVVKGLFERHTELIRKTDEKLLAKARTLWAPIDPATMRPTVVGPSIFELFSTGSPE